MDEKRGHSIKIMPAKILCIHERIAVGNGEPDIRNVLKKGLKRHGFAVDTFNDPHAVLASFNLSIMTL